MVQVAPWKHSVKEMVITLLFPNDLGWFLQQFKEEIVGFLMVIKYWYVYIGFFWVNLAFISTFLIEMCICPHKRMEFLILSSSKNRAFLKLIKIKNFKARIITLKWVDRTWIFLKPFSSHFFILMLLERDHRAVERWDILHFSTKMNTSKNHPAW